MLRWYSFIFRTDRIGNLNRIRKIGIEQFSKEKIEKQKGIDLLITSRKEGYHECTTRFFLVGFVPNYNN